MMFLLLRCSQLRSQGPFSTSRKYFPEEEKEPWERGCPALWLSWVRPIIVESDTEHTESVLNYLSDNTAVHHTRAVLTAINATGALVVFL